MLNHRVCWVLPLLMASAAGVARADTDLRIYGYADVSIDEVNNGLKSQNFISSNGSYIGFAAQHDLNDNLKVVAQIEGQADIAASPSVKDTFGFRNSFLGFASKNWGSIKAGKNDTPYKTATASFDPFANTIGDYNAIMGNTGGDGRVEFDQRANHAIWYESPAFGPLSFTLMYAPGQNAAGDSSDFPQGDNVCTGSTFGGNGSGNAGVQNTFGGSPGTGRASINGGATVGTGFGECTDGAFGDLYSGSVVFKSGGLLAVAAAELHHAVNRASDAISNGGTGTNEFGQTGIIDAQTEWAAKIGVGYDFGVIKVYAAGEYMRRTGMPSGFNERTRYGTYGSATYRLTANDELSLAYAHAFKTSGSPGVNTVNGGFCPGGDANQDNAADLFAVGARHYFTPAISVYLVGALNHNDQCAHFGLGQSGHGLVFLSRGQFNETFAGKDLYGISAGTSFKF
jgi:predicted porin